MSRPFFIGSEAIIGEYDLIERNPIIKSNASDVEKSNIKYHSKNPFHIGYFADGPWSHRAFNKINSYEDVVIDFICVRFDSRDPVLCKYAEENDIDLLISPNINSDEFLRVVRQYNSDIFVSMSFNQIFKKKLIDMPRLSTINCHAGKLPFYRGRNVLNWALINDEKEFGVTVHYVDSGIDTGDIIIQNLYSINDNDNYGTLLERAYEGCAETLTEAINKLKNGEVERISQESIHTTGFYCGGRINGDEVIDWNQSSRELFNFIRAISDPGPKARAYINNKEMKINRSQIIEQMPTYKNTVGQIVGKDDYSFVVKTSDTALRIVEYEYDGKIRIGDRFKLK